MSTLKVDINLEQPIETQAGRAAKQVDVIDKLLVKLIAGFEPDSELLNLAESLGVDVQSIRAKVDELYGEPEDD